MATKSMRTKHKLANALEELLATTPLSKITVRSIVEKAGTNRQTFYYHFETLNDLIVFLCHERLSVLSETINSTMHLDDLFTTLVQQIDENRKVLAPLLAGVGRPAMRELFFDDANTILKREAYRLFEKHSVKVDELELQQWILYCQYATATILIDWINNDSPFDLSANQLANFLCVSFNCHMNAFALRYTYRR